MMNEKIRRHEEGSRQLLAVQFDRVTKSFSNFTAITDISLPVKVGSFTAVVGPSGCGKSTLLNLAAGLEAPTRGHVFVNGHKIDGPTEGTALLFQDYNLFPWLTALDNVAFGLRSNGIHKAEARQEALRFLGNVGLASVANKTLKRTFRRHEAAGRPGKGFRTQAQFVVDGRTLCRA